MTRADSRNKRRQAKIIRAGVMNLLQSHSAALIARVWVKELSTGLDPVASYCFALQDIARHFSSYVVSQASQGVIVCDSRGHQQNIASAHAIFTDKFRTGGDPTPGLTEVPLFGASDNHAGLQVSDLIASTFLFPMAASAYCGTLPSSGLFPSPHSSNRYHEVRRDFGKTVNDLQYRYVDENGKWRGGVVVSDRLHHKPGSHLFKP